MVLANIAAAFLGALLFGIFGYVLAEISIWPGIIAWAIIGASSGVIFLLAASYTLQSLD